MLAWIAKPAPQNLKTTYFSVMTTFVNLALLLTQLLTKHLNQILVITREAKNLSDGIILIPADYSQLGWLLMVALALGVAMPISAIALVKRKLI